MNVYDFDRTIYYCDSYFRFFCFCLKHYSNTRAKLVRTAIYAILYGLRIVNTKKFKEEFFSVLERIQEPEIAVTDFWSHEVVRIKDWYIECKEMDDVIITASPEFLIKPIAEQIGVRRVIGTKMDPHTGIIAGENCKGLEKVIRFKEMFPDSSIDEFYSDSESDFPLADIAKKAYIVKGNDIREWKTNMD